MTDNEELLPFCECGECGLRVTKKGNRFIHNHHRRGVPQSPEHSYAIHKALIGVPLSPENIASLQGVPKPPRTPEHNAEMSEIITNSEAAKVNWENMRGGDDIVWHHWLYDHNDLSLNTVQMTRSNHMKLHHSLKRLGCIIPHINLPDEDSSETRDEDL